MQNPASPPNKIFSYIILFIVSFSLNQSQVSAQQIGSTKGVLIKDSIVVRSTVVTPQLTIFGWFVKPYLNGQLFQNDADPNSIATVHYGLSATLKVDLQYGSWTDVWGSMGKVNGGSNSSGQVPPSKTEGVNAVATGGIFVVVLNNTPLDAYRGVFVRSSGDTIKPVDGFLEMEVSAGETFEYVANGVPPEEATANVQIDICYPNSIEGCGSKVATMVVTGICPLVSIVPEELQAGESATVTVKGKTQDGRTVDYPAGTTFTVSVQSGGEVYGTLVGSGGSGATITSTSPAQFVVNESIDIPEGAGDSVVITIHAEPLNGSGLAKGNGVQTIDASMCTESPDGNFWVIGDKFEKCGTTDLAVNIPPNRSDNNSYCNVPNVHGNGAVTLTGGNAFYDWYEPGQERTSFTVCKDVTGKIRKNLSFFGLYVTYGVCENNLPGEVIKDLSTIPCSKVNDVINDFTDQINFLKSKSNVDKPVPGRYSFFDAYLAHEYSHVQTMTNILVEVVNGQKEDELKESISKEEGLKYLTDDIAYQNKVSNIQARIQEKAEAGAGDAYVNGDEFKSRKAQAEVLKNAIEQLKNRCK